MGAYHEICDSESLVYDMRNNPIILTCVVHILQLKPLLDKVVKLRSDELAKNTALRAANSQYEGDGSVQRLARETETCVEAYSQVGPATS